MKKKKFFKVIFVCMTVWILLGMYVRRDVPYLMNYFGLIEGKSPKKHIKDDDFVFGFRYCQGDLDMLVDWGYLENIVWLNDDCNAKMWTLLLKSKYGACESSDNFFMAPGYKVGKFYVLPRWVSTLRLKAVVLPFLPWIEMYYWPQMKLLYISQDIEELSYDFMYGLNITNVPSELLDILNAAKRMGNDW